MHFNILDNYISLSFSILRMQIIQEKHSYPLVINLHRLKMIINLPRWDS